MSDLDLSVAPGEIVGLAGESGSGKSSVLRSVAGLLAGGGRVSSGSIVFEGEELLRLTPQRRRSRTRAGMAYVFQNPQQSLDPLFRVGTQFDECLQAHGVTDRSEIQTTKHTLLREMGFTDISRVLGSYPHELSGGMCQRVVLAMAVACRPRLLLADEPTSALDVVSQEQVLGMLLRLREEHGMAVLVVSHNIAALARVADRLGVMYQGHLVELGERNRVLRAPRHAYTKRLIASVPRTDGLSPSADMRTREV